MQDQQPRKLKALWLMESDVSGSPDEVAMRGPLRKALVDLHADEVELTVAYTEPDGPEEPFSRDGVVYVPLNLPFCKIGLTDVQWSTAARQILRVIDCVQPDVIQCFGAEWPHGAIALHTSVPVVVHMMGFLNLYHPLIDTVESARYDQGGSKRRLRVLRACANAARQTLGLTPPESARERSCRFELNVMQANRYFMGRTDWDRRIVKYYSPGSRYFHIPEIMKPTICASAGAWRFHGRKRLQIVSVSSADYRKGNEAILRAALLLKELVGIEFEWKVAGNREFFPTAERATGITRDSANVRLVGRLAPEQVARELAEADLFVHPSIIDNSPNSVCEAQVVGCPVIASNVGGIPQLVEHGETGFLYPYNEPHTLAFLIGDIHRDADLLTRISRNEVETAAARHDPRAVSGAVVQAYRQIACESQARA